MSNQIKIREIRSKSIALYRQGNFKECEKLLIEGLDKYPKNVDLLINLAVVLRELLKVEKAKEILKEALNIDIDNPIAHNNIANIYVSEGKSKKAITHYKKSLEINPKDESTIRNLGRLYQSIANYDEAIQTYKLSEENNYVGRILECLFFQKSYKLFWDFLYENKSQHKTDIKAAAISAYAANQLDHEDPYPFCPNPLDYIYKTSINFFDQDNLDTFLKLKEHIKKNKDFRRQELLNNGLQTGGNFFSQDLPFITQAKDMTEKMTLDYYKKFHNSSYDLITRWPEKSQLYAWAISMMKNGNLNLHNHTTGWLSGSFYISMPKQNTENEGAIVFSIRGMDYPVLDESKISDKIFNIRPGDIIMFPSSLFHGTVPFSSEENRVSFAFDKRPEWNIDDFKSHY